MAPARWPRDWLRSVRNRKGMMATSGQRKTHRETSNCRTWAMTTRTTLSYLPASPGLKTSFAQNPMGAAPMIPSTKKRKRNGRPWDSIGSPTDPMSRSHPRNPTSRNWSLHIDRTRASSVPTARVRHPGPLTPEVPASMATLMILVYHYQTSRAPSNNGAQSDPSPK